MGLVQPRLSDGSELMVYRLRRRDGTRHVLLVRDHRGADGSPRRLARAEFGLEPLATVEEPASGARYPSGWRLLVPAGGSS